MDQWLIRTAQNWIAGPYTKEQVCKMILDRQLGLEDEVCSANGYWIYLNEANEIREQLGIEVPKKLRDGEEITLTQTAYIEEEPTDPDLVATPTRSLSDLPESVTESTGVIDASLFRELKSTQQKKKGSVPSQRAPHHFKGQSSVFKPFPAVEVKGHHSETWIWQKVSLIVLALAGFVVGIAFLYRVKK